MKVDFNQFGDELWLCFKNQYPDSVNELFWTGLEVSLRTALEELVNHAKVEGEKNA